MSQGKPPAKNQLVREQHVLDVLYCLQDWFVGEERSINLDHLLLFAILNWVGTLMVLASPSNWTTKTGGCLERSLFQ